MAFQNIKRTFLGRPFRHCIPTNVTNNYPQARSLLTRDQQTSPAGRIREDEGMSLNKRLLGDLIKGRQVYDASYHQADCNFRLLIGQLSSWPSTAFAVNSPWIHHFSYQFSAYICAECRCYPNYMFRNKKEHDEIVREMDLEKKCHPCTFLEHAGNHGDPNIVDISGALVHLMCLSVLIRNSPGRGRQRCQKYFSPRDFTTIYFSLCFKRYK